MSVRHLDILFRPRSVAVIGASTRPDRVGHVVLRNLLDGAFEGPVFAVHPSAAQVAGVSCHPDVASLPRAPDLAVICTPAATVAAIVKALGRRGTRAAIVVAAGFATGEEREVLLRAAGAHGLRLLGPNTLGLLVPGARLNASFAHAAAIPGDLAFLSQSGAVCTAVLDWALARGVGFSHFVALGDSLDVDAADVLDQLGADAGVRAILLYLRSVAAGRKFLSAARAAARNKPVLVVRSGRGGPAAADGAVLRDQVYDAAFRRAGMLRVDRIQDLFDAAETLARSRRPRGERLALLTHGSGLAALACDALLRGGGRLAALSPGTLARLDQVVPPGWSRENPVDIRGDAGPERYAGALAALLDDPETDTVLVLHAPTALAGSESVARAIAPLATPHGHPVLASWLGGNQAEPGRRLLREAGIPTYDTPDEAVSAFLHLVAFRRNQEVLTQAPPSAPEADAPRAEAARALVSRALADGRGELMPEEARAVLAAYGVPMAESQGSGSSPQPRPRSPGAPALRMGALVDPVFGPVLHFGEGGGAASAGDRAVGFPPLNLPLARELVSRTRVAPRLSETGAQATIDAAALYRALVGLAQLLVDRPEVVEVDVDPLLADARGVLGLEARVRVAPAAEERRLAIRPYPRELEEEVSLPGGLRVLLRPIRPEDEPAHAAFFARLSPDDIRFRFFNLMREVPHSQLARYTQIDYDREMAFIATGTDASGAPETLGVARGIFLADGTKAEFAVVVRSDLKGHGLGHALLAKLIRYCRARGTRTIVGQVLPDNRPMLDLARRLGFESRLVPDDGVVEVKLPLA